MRSNKSIVLIGYSGHAYVVKEIFDRMGERVAAYCEYRADAPNPFSLQYLGWEGDEQVLEQLKTFNWFVALGENSIRAKISRSLKVHLGEPLQAIHPSATISRYATLAPGVMVAPRVVINAMAEVQEGVICNTGAIVEHECTVGAYAHLAPGAVLCGGAQVGELTLIGANAVILPGITIGRRVRIGAGAVIIKDVADGQTVVGNRHRLL